MATIKSMYGKDLDITPSTDFPGWVKIRCKDDGSRLYRMVDVANALGLDPAPRPRPTLPDVKPGAVIRYTDKDGDPIQVTYAGASFGKRRWYDADSNYSDANLLDDVNDDGFTVVLEGL